MRIWGGSPFDSDLAAGWLKELEDETEWDAVISALHTPLAHSDAVSAEDASVAIAAADVVAQAISTRRTDEPTRSVIDAFIARAGKPSPLIVQMARDALAIATGTKSGLYETWAEADAKQWVLANAIVARALRGEADLPIDYASEYAPSPLPTPGSSLRAYASNAVGLSGLAVVAALLVVFIMTLLGANEARLWASGLGSVAITLAGAAIVALGLAHLRDRSHPIGLALVLSGALIFLSGLAFRWYFSFVLAAT